MAVMSSDSTRMRSETSRLRWFLAQAGPLWPSLLLFSVLFLVLSIGLASVEGFERLYDFTRTHEGWDLDEVIFGLVAALIAYAVAVAHRAWQLAGQLRGKQRQLAALNRIQSHYISEREPRELFDAMLVELLTLTDSELGFIDEVRVDEAGKLYLHTHAITSVARNFPGGEGAPGEKGEIFHQLDSLYGAAISGGEPVIANDPANDPRGVGVPEGHPPLNAYLGVPLRSGDRLVGLIGLANRPGGYPRRMVDELETVWSTCARVLDGFRAKTYRREAERGMERARREAEAANRAKSEFLAMMSHEIRTPMNAIIGMGELLGEGEQDETRRDYLRVQQRAAGALLELIDDVLDISRVESGRLELEEQPFELRELVESVVDVVAPRARERGIEVVLWFAPGAPRRVVGDRRRLRQILLNLAGNAVKFTERGGVRIEVAPAIEEGERRGVRFVVRDTGIGIAAEHQERIFHPFTQVESSLARRYQGSGLGLNIVHRLVAALGGRIGLESSPGEGSVFHFVLPLREDAGDVARGDNGWRNLRRPLRRDAGGGAAAAAAGRGFSGQRAAHPRLPEEESPLSGYRRQWRRGGGAVP